MIHTKALSSRLTHPMAMVVATNGHCPTVALIARAAIGGLDAGAASEHPGDGVELARLPASVWLSFALANEYCKLAAPPMARHCC